MAGSFYNYFIIYAYVTRIIVAIIWIVVATFIASPLLISTICAHGVTGKTVMLNDDISGHSKSQNPEGTKNTFTMVDPDVSHLRSTVLVSIRSFPHFNVCNVDYIYSSGRAFQLHVYTS
jgi:hypothetical protein